MDMGVSLTPPYILSIVNANVVRGHVEAGLKLGQAPTALGGLPALKNKQKSWAFHSDIQTKANKLSNRKLLLY